MSRAGEIITAVSPDKERIPGNIKRKKIPETFIKGKEIIQVPDNQGKKAKEDSLIDENKIINNKKPHHLKISKATLAVLMRTRESDDSPSDTDGCEINLGNKHKNE